jgi:hypothetical protein
MARGREKMYEKMDAMTLDELRALAQGTSIKKPGEEWSSCCPPDGSKEAILAALKSYGDQEAKGLSPHSLVAVPMYAADEH